MKHSFQLSLIRFWFSLVGRILPKFAADHARKIWVSTRRFPVPKREVEYLSTAKQHLIDCNGLSVAVYEWGKGPNVYLIHGWNGRASQLGKIALALSKAGYRAIAMDLPAHGKTAGNKTNAIAMMVALEAIINHFGDVHTFVTHSFGLAPVVLLLTKLKADTVQNVVAISPSDNIHRLVDQFAQTIALPASALAQFYSLVEKEYGEDIWDRISADKNVDKLNVPTLLIHDAKDKMVSVNASRSLVKVWPDSLLEVTSELGHVRILHNKDVIDKVVSFVTK